MKEGASAGCGFAMSETGWSNSLLFQDYLKKHFLKFVPKHGGLKVLVLYDGSSTPFSAELIDWALTQDIVLFVIPLQPLATSTTTRCRWLQPTQECLQLVVPFLYERTSRPSYHQVCDDITYLQVIYLGKDPCEHKALF